MTTRIPELEIGDAVSTLRLMLSATASGCVPYASAPGSSVVMYT
jgi:hypothetical protein